MTATAAKVAKKTISRKNGRERRDAILDAALACFARQGILDTGIEDVRKAAGASPSSVYHLFGGMNDILFGLLERTVGRLYRLLSAAALAETTGENVVRGIVSAQLTWVVESREEARFMYQALALELVGPRRREISRMKSELKKEMFAHLDGLVGAGLAALPPYALELVLLGPTHHACRGYLAGTPVDFDWVRENLSELAWSWIERVAAGKTGKTSKAKKR